MHDDKDYVRKFLKPLFVGRLADDTNVDSKRVSIVKCGCSMTCSKIAILQSYNYTPLFTF